jgi:hypothetical protein
LDRGVKTTMLQWLQQQARELFAEDKSQCPLGHLFTHYNPHMEQIFKMFKKLKYLGKETV